MTTYLEIKPGDFVVCSSITPEPVDAEEAIADAVSHVVVDAWRDWWFEASTVERVMPNTVRLARRVFIGTTINRGHIIAVCSSQEEALSKIEHIKTVAEAAGNDIWRETRRRMRAYEVRRIAKAEREALKALRKPSKASGQRGSK